MRAVCIVLLLGSVGLARAQSPEPAPFDESEFDGPEADPLDGAPKGLRSGGPETDVPFAAEPDPGPEPEEEALPPPVRGTLRAPSDPSTLTPTVEPRTRGSAESEADAAAQLPDEGPRLVTERAVAEALQRRAASMAIGDQAGADVALQELVELKRSLGIRNIVLASALLVREAKQEMEAGRPDRAVELSRMAVRLAPDVPVGHWMLARSLLDQDASQVVQIASALQGVLGTTFGVFRNAVTLWGWLLAVGLATFGIVTLGYAFVQMAKYVRYPASDIAERLPGVLGSGEFSLVLWIVTLLPFAFGFGLVTSCALALAIPFAYQSLKERVLSGLFALGLACTPWVIGAAAPFVLFHGSDADMLAMALQETLSPEEQARFQSLSGASSDLQVRVQAYRARQRGEIQEALDWYSTALQERPNDPALLNNSAVLWLQVGEEEKALAQLQAASRSSLAEPRLNLSLLLADDGEFQRADQLLEQARGIDPQLTAEFTDVDGSKTTVQRMLEVPLKDSVLWGKLLGHDGLERRRLVEQVWEPVGGAMPPVYFPIWVLLCALGATIADRRRARLSTPCTRCGRPADRGEQTPLCEQCVSVFITGAGVEAQMRRDKEAEVRGYQRRRRMIERIMGPLGLGLVLGDRPLTGVAVAFLVAFAVVGTLGLDYLSISAWNIYVDDQSRQVLTVALVALGVVAAAVAVRKSFER